MKVGYVLDRYPSLHQTFVLNEMLALEARGMPLAVFSLKRPVGLVHDEAARLSAPIVYAPSLRRFDRLAGALSAAAARRPAAALSTASVPLGNRRRVVLANWLRGLALAPYVARLGVDHLHAHFATGANVTAMVMARWAGVTFSFTTHAVDLYARPVMLCATLRHARFGVTSTEYNHRFIAETCGSALAARVGVIRACIEPEAFDIPWRSPNQTPCILSVGRLVEKKGHRVLIESFGLLRDRGYRFEGLIVGEGPEHSALAAAIDHLRLSDQVWLRGSVTQTDLRALYRGADILALPCVVAADGDRDGIPVTLIEAMAAGLPVVSTSISGIPELVSDDVGILVPPRDPVALADALGRLLDEPASRERMARNGPGIVRQSFNVSRSAEQLAALFAGVDPRNVSPADGETAAR